MPEVALTLGGKLAHALIDEVELPIDVPWRHVFNLGNLR